MVIDFERAKEMRMQREVPLEPPRGFIESIMGKLDAVGACIKVHQAVKKPHYRKYRLVTGYVCDKCGSSYIVCADEEVYRDGLDDYILDIKRELEEYRNKEYRLKYRPDEAYLCMRCNRVISLSGSYYERAVELSREI